MIKLVVNYDWTNVWVDNGGEDLNPEVIDWLKQNVGQIFWHWGYYLAPVRWRVCTIWFRDYDDAVHFTMVWLCKE